MCSKQFQFEPTHVYANICPRLLSDEFNKEEHQADKDLRRVEVSGSAEYSIPPEQSVLTVIISNRKEKAEEARLSVTRRLDYVNHMLTNHGVQKCDIEVTQNMSRVNGRGWFLMEAQVDAVFHNKLHKCLQVRNVFVEKLDKSVLVLPVTLRHNKQNVEALRKKACLAALANARQKALEICRLMGQCLGRPVFITENIIREWKGECSADLNGSAENDNPPLTAMQRPCVGELDIQRRIKEESLTVKVDVTATFEIKGKFEKLKDTKVVCRSGRRAAK